MNEPGSTIRQNKRRTAARESENMLDPFEFMNFANDLAQDQFIPPPPIKVQNKDHTFLHRKSSLLAPV
jgi:hypothetical protein